MACLCLGTWEVLLSSARPSIADKWIQACWICPTGPFFSSTDFRSARVRRSWQEAQESLLDGQLQGSQSPRRSDCTLRLSFGIPAPFRYLFRGYALCRQFVRWIVQCIQGWRLFQTHLSAGDNSPLQSFFPLKSHRNHYHARLLSQSQYPRTSEVLFL